MWHSRTTVPPSDGAFRNPVTLIIELKDEDKAKKDGPLYEKIRFEHKALMLMEINTLKSGCTDNSSPSYCSY